MMYKKPALSLLQKLKQFVGTDFKTMLDLATALEISRSALYDRLKKLKQVGITPIRVNPDSVTVLNGFWVDVVDDLVWQSYVFSDDTYPTIIEKMNQVYTPQGSLSQSGFKKSVDNYHLHTHACFSDSTVAQQCGKPVDKSVDNLWITTLPTTKNADTPAHISSILGKNTPHTPPVCNNIIIKKPSSDLDNSVINKSITHEDGFLLEKPQCFGYDNSCRCYTKPGANPDCIARDLLETLNEARSEMYLCLPRYKPTPTTLRPFLILLQAGYTWFDIRKVIHIRRDQIRRGKCTKYYLQLQNICNLRFFDQMMQFLRKYPQYNPLATRRMGSDRHQTQQNEEKRAKPRVNPDLHITSDLKANWRQTEKQYKETQAGIAALIGKIGAAVQSNY